MILISSSPESCVQTIHRKAMETQTKLGFMETARLCMETLMEQYFGGPVGSNVLFMVFSDEKQVDCAIAGNGANIINTLCNCCNDNSDVLTLLSKTVNTMMSNQIGDQLQNLIDRLKDIRNGESDE